MANIDCNLLFIVLSVIVGICTVIAGVLYIISLTFKAFILGVYFWYCLMQVSSFSAHKSYSIFGLSTVLLEIFFANALLSWFGFYARWLGKGLFFIFLGVLILETNVWYYLAIGVFDIVVGAIYIILHFIPAVGSPKPVRGHQGHEGAPGA